MIYSSLLEGASRYHQGPSDRLNGHCIHCIVSDKTLGAQSSLGSCVLCLMNRAEFIYLAAGPSSSQRRSCCALGGWVSLPRLARFKVAVGARQTLRGFVDSSSRTPFFASFCKNSPTKWHVLDAEPLVSPGNHSFTARY